MRNGTPFDFFRLGVAQAKMMGEAQAVIAMRLAGMAGIWSVLPSENMRMITEKQAAFTRAWFAAAGSASKGQSSTQIATAALRPVAKTASANRKRLARRGLK
ncbi:antifreeze protein [Algicella marina]|uniref:Antifreeze protein n=1 Tax=Algicella marina TaxID=2683284 RepID=A0A6P1T1N2_9RHOB|nr:antifreeze protein [Algicella marina]QHQ36824.1 antifreeze protein [Algicella marina]